MSIVAHALNKKAKVAPEQEEIDDMQQKYQ